MKSNAKTDILYAEVIIPLRFRESVTYSIPKEFSLSVQRGSIVTVTLVGRSYTGIVKHISETPRYSDGRIISLSSISSHPPVPETFLDYLEQVASYYLCMPGEVFKFALPPRELKKKDAGKIKTANDKQANTGSSTGSATLSAEELPILSEEQSEACSLIRENFRKNQTTLLWGVTGSGKTEIYITLIAETLRRGKSVLYLLPEIVLCSAIEKRLKRVFGNMVMLFHSQIASPRKREYYKKVIEGRKPYIVVGTRSALFLPYRELGMIVVDEEHDSSYKQIEPSPRYNGRDCALMLGSIMKVPVLLGSATPSLETLYNIEKGKHSCVMLKSRYYGGEECRTTFVDMRKERRKGAVKGAFSKILIQAIKQRIERGEQCLIFRSRRAYATALECPECGWIPRCPKCNLPLVYHKFNRSLSCHTCSYTEDTEWHKCPQCGKGEMKFIGDGTERIEEQLHELFPEAAIERFDSDTTSRPSEQERILRGFSKGETDILVGTQMISKGFDFKNLTLIGVIKAESMTSIFDFRADEKREQLITQLKGRAGRRGNGGEIIIQTTNIDENGMPVTADEQKLLSERKMFGYPPFVRLIRLTVRSAEREELHRLSDRVSAALSKAGIIDFDGPVPPPVESINGEHYLQFMVKLPRSASSRASKRDLYEELKYIPGKSLIIDVDPMGI